jgi:DNA topoisomerase-1
VRDDRPGLSRQRSGRGFSYRAPDGALVRDRRTLARIKALAIPPAWREVWICPLPHGHLQATGRDARGRKQFRYHPRWREVRDASKYQRLSAFGRALPQIRQRLEQDLSRPGIPRSKVLALLVQLLESTFIRIGNEEYARTNRSFGLTTLQNRHVSIEGGEVRFRFRGKSGKEHTIVRRGRRLTRLVQQCRDLPGQDLFQYLDEAGTPQPVGSGDVNGYLQEIAGETFTAKDFRTWAGTVLLARELIRHPDTGEPPGHTAQVEAIARVAGQLGNTPAVCRRAYLHPALLAAYDEASHFTAWHAAVQAAVPVEGLTEDEAALLSYLERPPR